MKIHCHQHYTQYYLMYFIKQILLRFLPTYQTMMQKIVQRVKQIKDLLIQSPGLRIFKSKIFYCLIVWKICMAWLKYFMIRILFYYFSLISFWKILLLIRSLIYFCRSTQIFKCKSYNYYNYYYYNYYNYSANKTFDLSNLRWLFSFFRSFMNSFGGRI